MKLKFAVTNKYIFAALTAIVVFLIFADVAEACSCSSPSLDSAIETSSSIVTLKLQSVEKFGETETGYGVDRIKFSRLTVEKVFKGKLKIGQELTFAQGGGADCVWTFGEKLVGTEYLFFLGKNPGKNNLWRGFVCSRSNSIKGAAADLLYLEKLSKVAGKTRLSGTVTQEDKPAVEGESGSYNFLSDRKVIISGNGKNITLKTDKNGVYEIYDLPVGKYTVKPEKINGYKFGDENKNSVEIEIEAKSLTEQDFEYTIDNSITGKFFDANGKPLAGIYLDLLPANGNKPAYFYQGDSTDENGVFEFKEIPIGTYIIVVNEENKISARQPFGTFYYPNKTSRDEAAKITIGAGEHFNNLVVNAPTTAETVEISGTVLFDDGKPVSDGAVEFFNNAEDIGKIDKYKWDSRATTDENGKFKIKIFKGQKGILFGTMMSFVGEYEKCPQLDKLVKAKGNSVQDIETNPIQITADNDADGIIFKFSFPSCRKAKIE